MILHSTLLSFALLSPTAAGGDDRAALEGAIERATAWVDALSVDPRALRAEHDMKGKKHLVEKLFVYYQLWRHESDPARREGWVARFRKALEPTRDPAYHDFGASDIHTFREEIMPYVDAYYLATRLGISDATYAKALDQKVPLLVKDLENRAVHWPMMFVFFLQRLSYPAPVPMESLVPRTVLAARKGLTSLAREEIYALTHEIFVLSSYGEAPMSWPSNEARLYAQVALPALVARFIREGNSDLLAELIVSMKYAGFAAQPTFGDGLRWLRSAQNPNGSFGAYEKRRAEFLAAGSRYDVDVGAYLHNTETAIWALLEARELVRADAAPKGAR